MNTNPDDIQIAAALEVARLVYGGVSDKSPQWETCLRVVRSLSKDNRFPPFHVSEKYLFGRKAFEECATFNKTYPSGTKGSVYDNLVGLIPVEIMQGAMVFPSLFSGAIVMAFFSNVGWREIASFSLTTKQQTAAEELSALAFQAKQAGKNEMAISLCRAALLSDPKCWHALNEIGVHHTIKREHVEAVEYYRAALAENPNSGEILNNLGMELRNIGLADEAADYLRKAYRLLPTHEFVGMNTAAALDDIGAIDECMAVLDTFLERYPDSPNIHYNKALLLLSSGRLEQGWSEYRWRLKQPAISSHYEHFNIPIWDSEPSILDGKNVLVWGEQGIGDEILLASMLPDIIARAASVTVLCNDRLVPLFQRSFPTAVIDRHPAATAVENFPREPMRPELLPEAMKGKVFDMQMNQGDIGQLVRPTLESFPKRDSFLSPDFAIRHCYYGLLDKDVTPNKIVGISWHSNKNIRVGEMKGIPLKDMLPILATPGITFVNLQYGDNADEIEQFEKDFGIKIISVREVDPLADLDSFASLVAAMDLVVTTSNTTAHIAGGLGIKTWVLCPTGPGKLWYWFRDSQDSPWYSSVKLFRQPSALHWASTVNDVAEQLQEWVKC